MVYLRGLAIWLIIILAESLHGIARTLLLEPYVGDFRARQIAVFTGAAIILGIAVLFVQWLRAKRASELIQVGLLWLCLTVAFEVLLGRGILKYSWERMASDYNLFEGGLLPIGLLVLTLSPLLASKLHRGPSAKTTAN
ncbi:MAG: hypothetical protein ACKVZH_10270 [Blastocatellia bacterium]